MLYTLKSYETATTTIGELVGILNNQLTTPQYEKAGRIVLNLKGLFHRK
jgi:hypothetical protein